MTAFSAAFKAVGSLPNAKGGFKRKYEGEGAVAIKTEVPFDGLTREAILSAVAVGATFTAKADGVLGITNRGTASEDAARKLAETLIEGATELK